MSDVSTDSSSAPSPTVEQSSQGDQNASSDTSENNGTGESQSESGKSGAKVEAERKKRLEKYKYTVDGEEVEEEIDLEDREAIMKRLRLSRAAEKRMTEAKQAKAKAFDIVKQFEQDPQSVLERLGPKGKEIAEQFLLKHIKEDMLSPEEKQARQDKLELEALKKEKLEAEEARKTQAQKEKEYKIAQDFQATIIDALNRCKLPKSPALVKEAARLMSKNLELGLKLDASDLAQLIRENRSGDLKSIIADMDGDQLIEFFGEELANKVRKSDIQKLKAKQSELFGVPQKSQSSSQSQTKESRPMTIDEWKEQVNKRVQGP